MINLQERSDEAMTAGSKRRLETTGHNGQDKQPRSAARFAGTYDALDYRPTATFPASDAVARY